MRDQLIPKNKKLFEGKEWKKSGLLSFLTFMAPLFHPSIQISYFQLIILYEVIFGHTQKLRLCNWPIRSYQLLTLKRQLSSTFPRFNLNFKESVKICQSIFCTRNPRQKAIFPWDIGATKRPGSQFFPRFESRNFSPHFRVRLAFVLFLFRNTNKGSQRLTIISQFSHVFVQKLTSHKNDDKNSEIWDLLAFGQAKEGWIMYS